MSKWRGRFVQERLDGLYDEPRPGAPRTIDDGAIERVVTRALEAPSRGQTHWSLRWMAWATGLSRVTISRIWDAFGLPPHRREMFKLVKTHQVLGQLHRRHRWVEFRTFVDAIDAAVPAELAVNLVTAKYGSHKTPLIRRWLAKPGPATPGHGSVHPMATARFMCTSRRRGEPLGQNNSLGDL